MELGLITFADVGSVSPEQRLKNLLEEAKLADELGFRYMRFHDILADDFGTVKMVDGKPVYDWTKIDQQP